jgi:hypothetical protein
MKTIRYLILFIILTSSAYPYYSADSAWKIIRIQNQLKQNSISIENSCLYRNSIYNKIDDSGDTLKLENSRFDGSYRFLSIVGDKYLNIPAEVYKSAEEYTKTLNSREPLTESVLRSYRKLKDAFYFTPINAILKNNKLTYLDSTNIPEKNKNTYTKNISNPTIEGDSIIWGFVNTEDSKVTNDSLSAYLIKYTGGSKFTAIHKFTYDIPTIAYFYTPSLHIDLYGNKWIYVNDSIIVFDGKNYKSFNKSDFPDDYGSINYFGNDSDSSVCFFNKQNYLYIYKNGLWKKDSLKFERPNAYRISAQSDDKGNVWLCDGFGKHILYKFNPSTGTITSYDCPPGYFFGETDYPRTVQYASKGKVYLTSYYNNFFIFDESKAKTSSVIDATEAGLPNVHIMNVYPNPVISNKAKLEFFLMPNRRAELKAELFSLDGTKVKDFANILNTSKSGSAGVIELDLADLPNGVYYAVLSINDENHVRGIIIQR